MNIECFNNRNNYENVLALDILNLTFEQNQLNFDPIEMLVEKEFLYAVTPNLKHKIDLLAYSDIFDNFFPMYINIQSSGKSYKNPGHYGENYIFFSDIKLNTRDRNLSLNAESKVVLWIHFKKIF